MDRTDAAREWFIAHETNPPQHISFEDMAAFADIEVAKAVREERERFWKVLEPIYKNHDLPLVFDDFIQVEFVDELMAEQEQEAMHGHR